MVIRDVTLEDEHLSAMAEFILCNWPSIKTEVQKELQHLLVIQGKIEIIDRIAIKGRRITIPTSLLDKAITQLHVIHMDTKQQEC